MLEKEYFWNDHFPVIIECGLYLLNITTIRAQYEGHKVQADMIPPNSNAWNICALTYLLIKSPWYTGGDFIFLYQFVRRRRHRPQILVHAITFQQLFGFLSFLARLLALTCRLPDYILGDFRSDLDLDFSRSNMEFAKNGSIATKQKANISIEL